MNELQKTAIDVCLEGHNLCLTGQAGTGKTFTVKRIKEMLEGKGKKVQISCTTGMACMQYASANTVHSWAGLQDGRYTTPELCHLVENNEKFHQAKENICCVDVLIIDEISMLSQALFEQLESLCRKIRKCTKVFGGIQIVVVGDFYQLQPVPSGYGDPGKPCMMSHIWKEAFPHHINLLDVMRQHEMELVTAVRQLARGEPSSETKKYIESLARPLPPREDTVKLFSRNIDVEYENDQMLAKIDEEAYSFESTDTGHLSHLRGCKAQQNLVLKKGCPIILITNLTRPLLNGLTGIVVDVDSSGPVVNFPSVGITKKIDRFQFTIYDREKQCNNATRTQFPLKLAYAITIHRAQGMTLESVEVDCRGAWKPGQVAVAIGRAKTSAGLRVINFHPAMAMKPCDSIDSFYLNPAINVSPSLPPSTCCKNTIMNYAPDCETMDHSDADSEFSDFGEAELTEADQIFSILDAEAGNATTGASGSGRLTSEETPEETSISPPTSVTRTSSDTETPSSSAQKYYDPAVIAESLKYASPVTKEQHQMNEIVNIALRNSTQFQEYANIAWDKLTHLFDNTVTAGKSGHAGKHVSTKDVNKFNSGVFALFQEEQLRESLKSIFHKVDNSHISFSSKFLLRASKDLLRWKASAYSEQQVVTSTFVKPMSVDGAGKVRYVGGMCVAKLKLKYIKCYHNNVHSKLKKKIKLAEKCQQCISILQAMERSYAELAEKSTYPESLVHTERKQNQRHSLTNISDESLEFFMAVEKERVIYSTKTAAHRLKENVLSYVTEEVLKLKGPVEKFKGALESVCHVPEDVRNEVYCAIVKKYLNVGNNQFRKDLLKAFSKKKKRAHRVEIAASSKKGETSAGIQSSEQTRPEKRKGKGKGKSNKKTKTSQPELFFCPACGKLYQENQAWISCHKCEEWYDRECSGVVDDQEWEELCSTDKQWLCGNCKKKY